MNEQWVKLFWNSLKCNPELYLGSNSDVPDREGPTMTFFRWIGFSSDSLNSVNWTVSGLQAVRWSCKVRCGNLISVFFFFFFRALCTLEIKKQILGAAVRLCGFMWSKEILLILWSPA